VNAGYASPKLLSWSIRFVIWALAVSMALEQVGVARQTVLAAFSIVFGALMLGLAIAFWFGRQGIGSRLSGAKPKRQEKAEIRGTQPL